MTTNDNSLPSNEQLEGPADGQAAGAKRDVLAEAIKVAEHENEFSIEQDLKQCESPAEKLFILGLWHSGYRQYLNVFPQYVADGDYGKHRVDFLITFPALPSVLEETKVVPVVRLAVEVDGHDFHERTKEQARRDRVRDRSLTASGYVVLRFTASEVWHDWRQYIQGTAPVVYFAYETVRIATLKWGELAGVKVEA